MKRVLSDGIKVTREEALEAMIHHLRLAALFFEAAPDDINVCGKELVRIMGGLETGIDTPEIKAGGAWLLTMHQHYEGLKDKYG